jgi:translation initiation factor IF-2
MESRIIYHITERVEKIVTGMLDPKEEEIILGNPKVGGIFYTSSKFMILGLILGEDQKIETHTKVRVIRGDAVIGK